MRPLSLVSAAGHRLTTFFHFGQRADWTEARVPLAALVPMFRGRTLSGPPLDRTRVEEIGLSLADGNPGAFALEVDWIRAE